MAFELPAYNPPDLAGPEFAQCPTVKFEQVKKAGVAPLGYHATSVYPEYFQLEKGNWQLILGSRMDCVVVRKEDGELDVVEFRRLVSGDMVACGRKENGEDGIYVHAAAFDRHSGSTDKFAFRTRRTRETSFSIDYDELYDLMSHEREHGFIVWVLGPAVVFDHDARKAFAGLVEDGYVHAVLGGNALATHDIEGALYGTALGTETYSKKPVEQGHYNHLDAINRISDVGSFEAGLEQGLITNGIMNAVLKKGIPYVLAGSIRDDGPMPQVITDVCEAQDRMRELTGQATTILALATQLHAIATGNMAPSYTMTRDGRVRPVYFYSVDMSEFAADKLADRGSLTARAILTNVQDFIVTVHRGLKKPSS